MLIIRVGDRITHILEEVDFAIRPLVKVDTFHLGNVHSQLSVNTFFVSQNLLTTASNANEDAMSDGGPSGDLAFTVSTSGVIGSLE